MFIIRATAVRKTFGMTAGFVVALLVIPAGLFARHGKAAFEAGQKLL